MALTCGRIRDDFFGKIFGSFGYGTDTSFYHLLESFESFEHILKKVDIRKIGEAKICITETKVVTIKDQRSSCH